MSRLLRIILVILMFLPALGIIPAVIYFIGVMVGGMRKGLRLLFWVLALIPILNVIGAIGLLLIELKVINVDSRR